MEQVSIKKTEQLKKLREEILALQGLRVSSASEQNDIGLGAISESFPNGVFPVAAVHEFISPTKEATAATSGFISGLLSTIMHKGSCLWVSSQQLVFPSALAMFDIIPDQIIFTTIADNRKKLWVIEEALKCEALSAVVGEVNDLSFTESRRLQLAVEKSHVTGFIHRTASKPLNTIACVSRWKVQPLASSTNDNLPGVGFPRWNVELIKIRNGKPGAWHVAWTDMGFNVTANRSTSIVVPMKKTG